MAKPKRRPRDPSLETWWVELEHATFGTVKICCTWARISRGIYAVVPIEVEHDLFTPQEIADQMDYDLKAVKARILLNDISNRSNENVPW
jgi:hypothetical protein